MSSAPQSGPSGNVLVVTIAGMFICVIAAATLLSVAVEDGARVESLIVIMLASLTTTIAAVAGLYVSVGTKRQVDFLANGGTDSKIRAGIADMVHPEFLRDDVSDQLAVDRAVRDRQTPPVPLDPPPAG